MPAALSQQLHVHANENVWPYRPDGEDLETDNDTMTRRNLKTTSLIVSHSFFHVRNSALDWTQKTCAADPTTPTQAQAQASSTSSLAPPSPTRCSHLIRELNRQTLAITATEKKFLLVQRQAVDLEIKRTTQLITWRQL